MVRFLDLVTVRLYPKIIQLSFLQPVVYSLLLLLLYYFIFYSGSFNFVSLISHSVSDLNIFFKLTVPMEVFGSLSLVSVCVCEKIWSPKYEF